MKGKTERKNYKLLRHTADILFEASGKNFEDALQNAARAMFDIIASGIEPREKFEIEERAKDLETLVVFCLSKLLSESEAREMLLCKFEVGELKKEGGGGYLVRGTAWGERGRKPKDVVKAVTFHELKVRVGKRKTTIRVLLDV
ncbi:MAG: archease [Candidatus Micrarchaeota archaeon]